MTDKAEVSTRQILTAALAVQAVALAIAVAGFHFTGIAASWGVDAVFMAIALGVAGALASYWIGRAITRSNTSAGNTLRNHCEKLHRVFCHLNWWQIGVLAVTAGVCEELLFRGFLQPWIASFSTPLVGLLVASVVFGLLHYASSIYFLITAVMGLILGAVYWLSESLLTVIVWHGVYDLIALGVLVKFPRVLGLNGPAGKH
ncbi:CPBP family intramembrane glutamic endopeptidase [Microbulbifer pacificus]|uniref:CPBP family intramembrane glutamic endopeptidase n=1 Tax=Microbulbifer pacificus TaxID=407164 RepID=A0AAU0MZ69_9GAMM|nr:CPBP family intramembrane glutamic endopeptidase [Microbulbifer pacificus]WOX05403.1 CPBP family intramembrane glutamic endopeptidase [Microbulbifer pacificus]